MSVAPGIRSPRLGAGSGLRRHQAVMLACRSPKHRAGGRALHQVWFGSVDADYKLAPRWTAALWLDMQQATTATSGREAEVTADLTYRISPAWKIDVYGVKGFAAGSPAVAGGIILTWQHRF